MRRSAFRKCERSCVESLSMSGACIATILTAISLAVATTYAGETPLGPEFRVNTTTTGDQVYPAVAAAPSGDFVVVWQSDTQAGGAPGIYAQRYAANGTPAGGEFQVNSTRQYYDPYLPEVAASAGGFVVTWDTYARGTADFNVYARRYDANGTAAGDEFQVNSSQLLLCASSTTYPGTCITSDSAGNFVVAWTNCYLDGDAEGVFARRFASTGAPLSSEFQVNTYATNYQGDPAIAADAAGNFVVAWTSDGQDGSGFGIFGQRYQSTGAAAGGEFQANTYTLGDQYYPDVAMTPGGDFIVVWASAAQDGSNLGVFGQRFAGSGQRLGTEFQVNLYTPGDQTLPRVTANTDGSFIVAWSSFAEDGNVQGVFGRRYDSTGQPAHREFIVNTTTAKEQDTPALASLSATDFVVAWASAGQDGDGTGIFGRRFTSAGPPPPPCVADCNANVAVSIDELITAIGIAIGSAPLSTCTSADVDRNGGVTVDELIRAVRAAQNGCA